MGPTNLQIPNFFQTLSDDISFLKNVITGKTSSAEFESKEHLQAKVIFAATRITCAVSLGVIAVKIIPSLLAGSVIGVTVYSIQALLARDIFVIARNLDQDGLGNTWIKAKSIWHNVLDGCIKGTDPSNWSHPMAQGTVLHFFWNIVFRSLERQYNPPSGPGYTQPSYKGY